MTGIRIANENEVGLIFDLARQIWPSAYLEIIGQDQIDYMLDKMYNEAELLKQMAGGHTFLIVERDHQTLGFAGFSLEAPTEKKYKLHKLYVLPQTQGSGLGKSLVYEVIKLVSVAGGKSLVLNVNKFNKAKGFYEKLGFTVVEDVKIDIGGGYFMDDFVMRLGVEGFWSEE